jgi:hypothetical protein
MKALIIQTSSLAFSLAILLSCDHNPGEKAGQSQAASADLDAGSCNFNTQECQQEIKANLAGLQAEIAPLLSDKSCLSHTECELVGAYGVCGEEQVISTRTTDEAQARKLISSYQGILSRLPKTEVCAEKEPMEARCIKRQCVALSQFDILGDNLGLWSRKLSKVIAVDGKALTFSYKDGVELTFAYQSEEHGGQTKESKANLRAAVKAGSCALDQLLVTSMPTEDQVVEGDVASSLDCMGAVTFMDPE